MGNVLGGILAIVSAIFWLYIMSMPFWLLLKKKRYINRRYSEDVQKMMNENERRQEHANLTRAAYEPILIPSKEEWLAQHKWIRDCEFFA